jgi:AcrR family transcriptional regulator
MLANSRYKNGWEQKRCCGNSTTYAGKQQREKRPIVTCAQICTPFQGRGPSEVFAACAPAVLLLSNAHVHEPAESSDGMPKKVSPDPGVNRRAPQQERARHKVGLILETAMRLLDTVEIPALTTNAIAAKAGISIGTLYQYFNGKEALLEALSKRELESLATKVMGAMDQRVPRSMEDRVRLLVGAVFDTYGGRRRVHRILLQHAFTHHGGGRLNPLFVMLTEELSREGRAGPRLTAVEAFVLTQAVAGVLRAVAASGYPSSKRQEVENALIRLVSGFVRAR